MKKSRKFGRNRHAISAHFRNSAGAMRDKRKVASVSSCRDYDYRHESATEDCYDKYDKQVSDASYCLYMTQLSGMDIEKECWCSLDEEAKEKVNAELQIQTSK